MPSISSQSGRDALVGAFDLFDLGVRIMRQNLRRQDQSATDEEIDRRLGEWMQHRPGAEDGDAVGRVVPSIPRRP